MYLVPEVFDVDGKKVIYIWIPEGTQVRRLNGRILDRTYEGDIDITDNAELVYKMYARKQSTYFVNKVYPKLGMEFLEKVLRWRQFCYLEKTVQSCRFCRNIKRMLFTG